MVQRAFHAFTNEASSFNKKVYFHRFYRLFMKQRLSEFDLQDRRLSAVAEALRREQAQVEFVTDILQY